MIFTLKILLIVSGATINGGDFNSREACDLAAAKAAVTMNSLSPPVPVYAKCEPANDRLTCTSVGGCGPVGWVFCGRDSDQPHMRRSGQ